MRCPQGVRLRPFSLIRSVDPLSPSSLSVSICSCNRTSSIEYSNY
ncbi:hypothetical protein DAI22_08g124232 [Oryza sativa Japonica Group]|nr:hypothetical protein DAI22_08g124232 [Oryza sativa Japonica Group]